MKNHKVALVALALFIVVACVYPVSADILSDYTADYDESTQRVHAKITLTGGEEGAHASEYPGDFVILMDVSLSMRDVYKDKTGFEWAKNSTIDFLESLYAYKSRVGVISFSDDATEVCQLTFNFEEVKKGIESVSSHGFSTNYGEGIQKAVLVLKGREREALPVIILLTDGGEEKGETSVEDAVDFAKQEGIMIYVVSFGQKGAIDDVMLGEKIVKQTGGEYRYTSFEGLGNALIGVQKLDEFLSAVNLRIVISQSEDAVLDYMSIEEMIKPGVTLTKKGYFEFVSPKLTPEKKIELKFDTFTAKEGDITAGIVNAYYINEKGVEEETSVPILVKVSGKPSWEMYAKVCGGVIIILIALGVVFGFRFKKVKEDIRREEERKNQNRKEDIKRSTLELRSSVEEELDKNKIIMSRELKEKFEQQIKRL